MSIDANTEEVRNRAHQFNSQRNIHGYHDLLYTMTKRICVPDRTVCIGDVNHGDAALQPSTSDVVVNSYPSLDDQMVEGGDGLRSDCGRLKVRISSNFVQSPKKSLLKILEEITTLLNATGYSSMLRRLLGVEHVGVVGHAPHIPNAVICVVHTIILTLSPSTSSTSAHRPRRLDLSGHSSICWTVLQTCRLLQFPFAADVELDIWGDQTVKNLSIYAQDEVEGDRQALR
ncbi:hypothetical protein BD410DRAFT_809420 [Rickenella mellea]|uniref:Uncharacterized protein n=1 Tax=Rickenella mellea TaxID=50990 RepID=A0A4Y7PHH6_9AGAM|nr:hypothetical protein BD410DRAFT_809420 [Rickenella mellea]